MNNRSFFSRIFFAAAVALAPVWGLTALAAPAAPAQSEEVSAPEAGLANPVELTNKKREKKDADSAAKRDAAKSKAAAKGTATSDKEAPAAAAKPAAPVLPPAPPPAPDDSPELKAMQKEIGRLTVERNLIEVRLALEEAKRRQATAERSAAKNAEQAEEKSRLEAEVSLENAKDNARSSKQFLRVRQLETDAKIIKAEVENTLAKQSSEIAVFQKKQEVSRLALKAEPKLLKEPLVNGVLYISNRRLALNGAVTSHMAEEVIEKLNFFNNQNSEYPIFFVIDNSPGGSVAAGFQILKAMESSKAPVYVVVKGYAASMAAVITTLAQRSYCYDNTIILHHQMSTGFFGNMKSLEDQKKIAEQWYTRLATPVAKKMGLDLETFTKQMYAHNADADWQEFGTEAKQLKWVDNVVDKIVETGIVDIRSENSEGASQPSRRRVWEISNGCELKEDAKGQVFMQLPVLENPFDIWWIYDKRGFYRAR
jgi:ATP-dependent Clp protease protease subunit